MNTLASNKYFELAQKKYLYNIMPIHNIASVIKNGILCHERAVGLELLWQRFRLAATS